jgi:hypothetical protein
MCSFLTNSVDAVTQPQMQDPKLTDKVEDSDKYGKGGKLQTVSDEKYFVVYQVWYDQNKKQREVYTPRHYDHATKIYYHQWQFYEPGKSETLVTIQYDPSAGTFGVDQKGKSTSKNATPAQVAAWVAQFEKRFAEDGTISAPWDEVATTVEQPTLKPTEVFNKPKEAKPDSKSDEPKKTDPPKEDPPKKDDPPKTDKTSTNEGANTASTTPTFTAPGYDVKIVLENGLLRVHETTPFGGITFNMPGDLQPGETFGGTIWLDPAGKNESEKARNLSKLEDFEIDLGTGITLKIPPPKYDFGGVPVMNLQNLRPWAAQFSRTFLQVLDGDKPLSRIELPKLPAPVQWSGLIVPTGGQQGGFITIPGPFDGVVSPTDSCTIGGSKIPILAESPHSRVVWDTSQTVGPSTITVGENGKTGTCPFNNVSVKLSAPNLHLLRGQTTVLTVVVSGLDGLKQDVPFELVNHSPGVVSMEGGNIQNLLIRGDTSHASDVQRNGTYTTTRTLTGITPGSFNITATVHWKETCKPAMEVMRLKQSAPVTNAGAQ